MIAAKSLFVSLLGIPVVTVLAFLVMVAIPGGWAGEQFFIAALVYSGYGVGLGLVFGTPAAVIAHFTWKRIEPRLWHAVALGLATGLASAVMLPTYAFLGVPSGLACSVVFWFAYLRFRRRAKGGRDLAVG